MIQLFFFQADVDFTPPPQSYKEVLFLQHRITLNELCRLVPWLLHITLIFCKLKWVLFGGRRDTSQEIIPSSRLDGNMSCLNSASKRSWVDCVKIFCFQRQETKSQERKISCCYASRH